eukprot:TRINITY_DN9540_c0_g2_i1.p1 TRINITY_DN9540_c0_g2~~TRINITY_DN9540_c0_g2_i1.p1  ORF type:complete len:156 (+),score=32.88 TRINITY_DN9540_c0_g2_i1:138-605(+)
MIRRPPRSTLSSSSAASDVYKRQALVVQGVLGLQLCLSHYDRPFVKFDDCRKMSWLAKQALQDKDVVTPDWMDWFHGGLNIHLVHHLFPRLPRCRFREGDRLVQALCKEHGIATQREGFIAASWNVLCHMQKASKYMSWKDLLTNGSLPPAEVEH